nr:hypothetical protein BaRGS_023966 [Batillaria attramentaria]
MVAGEVIQAERGNPERYFVAEDHKGALNGIGIAARLFASYAVRYDAVKACFRQDGPNGVSHNDFPDVFNVFHVMRVSSVSSTVDNMVPLVEGLGEKLEDGIDVVDFGCGTGVLVLELAKRFPNSRFHGSDISEAGVAIGRQQLAQSGLTNATFSCDDLENLPEAMHGKFDWAVTYDVIHDLPHPLRALNQINRSLKPGGVYVMGDIHTPKDRCGIAGDDASMGLYGMSAFLCLPASAAEDGALGRGAAWSVEEAQDLVAQSDLQFVKTEKNKAYFAYHICRKGEGQ